MITVSWIDAPKALPMTPPAGLSVLRAPVVRTGPVPRTLTAVPDLEPGPDDGARPGGGPAWRPDTIGTGHDVDGLPVVVLEALPGLVGPGGSTEFLVMAANPGPEPLPGSWLGLLLPPGVEVSSVTPPAGTVAVTTRSGDGEVVRARLPELVPGACVGLAVDVSLPEEPGPYQLVAFLTPCDCAELSLTCEHVIEVVTSS